MLVLEMVQRVGRDFASLPWLVRIGLTVMAAAFVGDLAVHLTLTEHHPAGHGAQEHLAHLAGVIGMVLVLGGIALSGARRHRSTRRSPHATR